MSEFNTFTLTSKDILPALTEMKPFLVIDSYLETKTETAEGIWDLFFENDYVDLEMHELENIAINDLLEF